ncbi:unnamed protein product [Durusdinium trenchii]|uniref:Ribosomal RNA large subunit methyltransferase K/L-like methyltransferase domain-containing protein n=1 Tax=Durusdinium trenchii TaxID=1381693 RepID=A0ABP0RI65_9DINO
MKQVEAWVLAKALQLQPGEVVLDPMCGKGTLLCEAAIWWPEASFIGCDVEAQQLEKCLANHRYLGLTELVVHQADAATLGGLPIADSSVDKLMCAPPWDRQFEAAGGLENFYPKMLEEFSRVLRSNGTMAFLLNLPAEEALKASLAGWRTCRCPFALTHHTVGVLLLAWKVHRCQILQSIPNPILSLGSSAIGASPERCLGRGTRPATATQSGRAEEKGSGKRRRPARLNLRPKPHVLSGRA